MEVFKCVKLLKNCKTSSLLRISSCGLPENSLESDFYTLLTQYFIPSETTVVVGLEPSYHPATNQGSRRCVHCYQSFAPVNSWVSTKFFTEVTLLLWVYLTYLKKNLLNLWHYRYLVSCPSSSEKWNNLQKMHFCLNFVW